MNNIKHIILIIAINIFFIAIYIVVFLYISFDFTVDKNLENSEKISSHAVNLIGTMKRKLANEHEQ